MQIYTSTAGGKQQGPYSIEEINERLRQGYLPPVSTLAWFDGCANWIPIAQVPGIVLTSDGDTRRFVTATAVSSENEGDATGGLIPYKNPHALAAYYLSIFGLFPLIGLLLAIPAFILGIMGLKKRKQNPVIKGSVHAWIGIVLGGLSIMYNGLLAIGLVIALLTRR